MSTSVSSPERAADEPATPRPERRFRPELQGLRALAALLVVVYHVWLDRVSGGVDVFFVITGFLLTGQLYRASRRGRIDFRALWGRVITRLFPAALTVLLATMAAAVVLLPENRWAQTIKEVVASALFVENWRLAADSADYFAQHSTASVVQHFWSLSIQVQFYLVWPVVVALIALAARRAGWGLRPALLASLGVVFALSLTYSVWLTAADQPLAYFHSATRVWEFALGGLLALAIDAVRLPRALRLACGWAGVLALVLCGIVWPVGTVFPGYAALWPTMAAVLVLLAGATGSRAGADRFLSSRPLVRLGDLSYALYLWHWPVLLLFLITLERQDAGAVGGAVVIAVSVALAMATHRWVENPVRVSGIGARTRWGAYRFGLLTLVPVLLAAGAWQGLTAQRASFDVEAQQIDTLGAHAVSAQAPLLDSGSPVIPPFAALPEEFDSFPDDECRYSPRHEDLRICTVDPEGPPTRRVVVVGDSHSQQYIAALRPVVDRRGWQIISIGKGGCPFTAGADVAPDCRSWNDAALAEILDTRPDAVITMATRDVRAGLTERTPPGYIAQWRALADADIPVVGIRDSPRFDYEPSECVRRHGISADRCDAPRREFLSPRPPYRDAPGVPGGVEFLDFSDFFCGPEVCPPVIGNVLVYMDDNHVTATYLETMSPMVEARLSAALRWHTDTGSGPRR
ncbi:acyltransferase [Saccharomonospora piscinae]|uniref:acyltransferase family protein n=1 Tax=Saccharomonospora piscinae TaxID=687388 RepID=UPI00110610FD|nr:acyltransferase family protein [Saccharomonospora piscinae]TLW94646.1 acyltransferase [Saccharomonospora piscinae]